MECCRSYSVYLASHHIISIYTMHYDNSEPRRQQMKGKEIRHQEVFMWTAQITSNPGYCSPLCRQFHRPFPLWISLNFSRAWLGDYKCSFVIEKCSCMMYQVSGCLHPMLCYNWDWGWCRPETRLMPSSWDFCWTFRLPLLHIDVIISNCRTKTLCY